MALFRKTISMDDLGSGQSDADRKRHGKGYSADTGGWTESSSDRPTAGTGATDRDESGARKWWQ
ncbi:hypothetical protein ACFWSP_35395 [Streptomyces sp. NPDC058618]|uniref:hypothetical protein n=1 Tax=Streptomyces sp. NPDC058618 TaxID=3346558 RepID=UPI00364EE210